MFLSCSEEYCVQVCYKSLPESRCEGPSLFINSPCEVWPGVSVALVHLRCFNPEAQH